MVANWQPVISVLRSKMLKRGLILPARPISDGRWHECGGLPDDGTKGSGAYLLLPDLLIALYDCDDGHGPEVWRADARNLTMAQEQRIGDAKRQRTAADFPKKRPSIDKVPDNGAARLAQHNYSFLQHVEALPDPAARETLVLRDPVSTPRRAQQAAAGLLSPVLADGAVPVVEVRAKAKLAGISWASVRRAAASLGIVVAREGFGRGGRWRWQLP